MKKFLLLSLLLLFDNGLRAQNTLLWEISGNGLTQNSYLFGTIHLICEDQVVMNDSIVNALKSCKSLVLEMDDKKVGVVEQLRGLRMRGDTTLKDLLTPEEYAEVERFFRDSLATSLEPLIGLKPFILSAIPIVKTYPCPAKDLTSMEGELRKAKKKKTKVDELESFAEQSAIIDSIPYREQAAMLLEGIRKYSEYKAGMDSLIILYRSGDIEAFHQGDYMEQMGEGVEAKLLVTRNYKWVPLIEQRIMQRPCFIAVGAAHLGGEEGLVVLLRAQGYTVRPIFY